MRDIRIVRRALGAILAAGLVACGPAAAAHAQTPPVPDAARERGSGWLDLAAEGTADAHQPVARLRLERPAFVAVFEVEPGVGATLLYPYGADDQTRLSEGEHAFRLNGLQQAFNRRTMLAHLGWAFTHRDPVVPYNHLLAVAADRPLQLDGLLSGRVFRHARAFAGTEEVTGALLAEVVGERPAGSWTLATTRYLKVRNEPLLFAFRDLQAAAPYLVLGNELQLLGLEDDPRIPALTTCLFGAETLAAFYHGLGAVGAEADCRRRLGELRLAGVPVPPRRPGGIAPRAGGDRSSAPAGGAGGTDGSTGGSGKAGADLDGQDRDLLRVLADATRSIEDDDAASLERLGDRLRRAGLDVPVRKLRRLGARSERWRSAARRRAERLRRLPGFAGHRPAPGIMPDREVGGVSRAGSRLRASPGGGADAPAAAPRSRRTVRPPAPRPDLPDRRRGGG